METTKNYLIKLYRENGELVEIYMSAPDDSVALDNARKGFERDFTIVNDAENTGMTILEEKL